MFWEPVCVSQQHWCKWKPFLFLLPTPDNLTNPISSLSLDFPLFLFLHAILAFYFFQPYSLFRPHLISLLPLCLSPFYPSTDDSFFFFTSSSSPPSSFPLGLTLSHTPLPQITTGGSHPLSTTSPPGVLLTAQHTLNFPQHYNCCPKWYRLPLLEPCVTKA